MREGSEIVEIGKAVYEVRKPELCNIYREFTNGEGRITTLGLTARDKGHQRILVGTSTGRVYIHDPFGEVSEWNQEHEEYNIMYKDEERRSITSLGGYKASNWDTKEMEYFVFVQVRTYGVMIFRDYSDSPPRMYKGKLKCFIPIREVDSDHYGFCPVRAYERTLYIPTSDPMLFILKDQSRSSANLENKGAPMCMDLLSDCPVIGAEDGTVAIYSYNASRADGSLKLSVMEKIFDSPVFSIIVYELFNPSIIAGSVGHPIKVLDTKTLAIKQEIPFPASARACGALCYTWFSPKEDKKFFIGGFWDGSIRIYRQQKDGSFVEKNVIESQQVDGDRKSTTSLVWMIKDELYSACEDGNLYSYEIMKTRKLNKEETEEYLRMKEESNKKGE